MSVPVWCLLGFALWTILVLLIGVGIQRWSRILTGRAQLTDFPADEPHGAPFYRRAMRAHANCVENLPLFGAVVFAAEMANAASPTIDALAITALGARLVQTLVHWASGANAAIFVRFLFFATQLVCFLWIGIAAGLTAL